MPGNRVAWMPLRGPGASVGGGRAKRKVRAGVGGPGARTPCRTRLWDSCVGRRPHPLLCPPKPRDSLRRALFSRLSSLLTQNLLNQSYIQKGECLETGTHWELLPLFVSQFP